MHEVSRRLNAAYAAGAMAELPHTEGSSSLVEETSARVGFLNERLHRATGEIREALDRLVGSEPQATGASVKDPAPTGGQLGELRARIERAQDLVSLLEEQVGRLAAL